MAGFGDLMRSVTKTFDKVLGRDQHGAAPEQAKTSTELKTPSPSPTPAEPRSEDVKKSETKPEISHPVPVENKQPETPTEPAPKPEETTSTPSPEEKKSEPAPQPEEKTPDPKPEAKEPAPNPEDLARSAVERLSEDESLRGDLSDVGFGPLLDWSTAAAEAYSTRAKDDAAMDDYTDKLRKVVQAAVNSAQNGKLDDLAELTDFDTDKKDKLTQDLKDLKLGEDADANAEQLAKILQAAL